MKRTKRQQELDRVLTLTMQQYLNFNREETTEAEKNDTLAFVFLIVIGVFFVTCAVFKCQLLQLIF